MAIGRLKCQCFVRNTFEPVDSAVITITRRSIEGQVIDTKDVQLTTDSSGLSEVIEIETPPREYSETPSDRVPYSLCDLRVQRQGFEDIIINGCQVYPDRTAYQICRFRNSTSTRQSELINILPNTLVGNYPSKIPEDPNKILPPPTSGVVLQKPVVPEFIVVHDGTPNNTSGNNYTVHFKEYVKNVASSEIFPTWPDNTIRANVFCIVSFALNRVYTEWYRAKGKPFQITNSTAYDQAFNYGRNIFDNISAIVDEIFSTYIRRPGKKQPLFTQYCDGKNVSCPGWLTQWGSKYLGDQGKTPFEILKSFYGNDIELVTAEKVEGIPSSYPGYTLTIGSSGVPVRQVQEYLNTISNNYPLIPKVAVDGAYNKQTAESVDIFQSIFSLPRTGDVDYATWYQISAIYVGVSKIAELRSEPIEEEEHYRYDKYLGIELPSYFYE